MEVWTHWRQVFGPISLKICWGPTKCEGKGPKWQLKMLVHFNTWCVKDIRKTGKKNEGSKFFNTRGPNGPWNFWCILTPFPHPLLKLLLHPSCGFPNLLKQGQIQDFLKEGAPKLRTDRTSAPMGTGGVWGGCAPSEAEKNCNFQSQFARFDAFLLLGAPTQSQVPYLWKK